jgi:hypothetical protein
MTENKIELIAALNSTDEVLVRVSYIYIPIRP